MSQGIISSLFPRYTREQNLSCKLRDIDIRMINIMNTETSMSHGEIARIMRCGKSTVWRWCQTLEKRKEMAVDAYTRQGRERHILKNKEIKRQEFRKYMQRKINLTGGERMREYYRNAYYFHKN